MEQIEIESTEVESTEAAYIVRAVVRVLDILDVLQESPNGVTLQEVQTATKLPKSSAFRYLATLASRGYARHDPATGIYQLGSAFLPSYARHLALLAARARPLLEELRDRFGETTNFGVLDGTKVAYLEILESPKSMRFAARSGERGPLHSTSLGKAIAMGLTEREIRSILAAEGMPRQTSNTITDVDLYLQEIEKARKQGFAFDNEENEEGGLCVAVPIPNSRVPMAISLSAPSVRFSLSDLAACAPYLKDTAIRLARELGVVGT
ncbi:MAG: IclR family transcriptional regulator [Anaerolineae bacterium]